jgi:hypothetical protein
MRYIGNQPVRKQLAARRATAGLAVANSREHNTADGCFLAGPKGAPQIGQCRVAVLVKGYARAGPASAASAVGLPCGLRLALADLGRSESRYIS